MRDNFTLAHTFTARWEGGLSDHEADPGGITNHGISLRWVTDLARQAKERCLRDAMGICGWGGMALNAAAIDTRIKATVTVTMYDMSRVNANGYFDSMNADARYELRKQLNAQRTEDARNGSYALAGGVVDPLPVDAPQFLKDYHSYYKTERGYHKRSLNSNNGWNKTSSLSFINMPILSYSDEIRSAVLMLHGEKAHSRYFSEDAFKKLKGGNKELLIIPDASHVDLYDNLNVIPFDRIERFFREYLK